MTPPLRGLRVLMTTDAVGGVWIYAVALARELCRRGTHVTLVTLGPPPRADQLEALRWTDIAVTSTDLAPEWMDPEGKDFARGCRTLSTLERRIKPDLVHLNSYREACARWASPVLVMAHSCKRSWWHACRGREPAEPHWQEYVANVGLGLVAADCWGAPSVAFRDSIEMLYAPPTPGRVIWNGIDDFPKPAGKEPYILVAGRLWDEAKNAAALLTVARDLDWPVRVAGSLEAPEAAGRVRAEGCPVEALGELSRSDLLAQMQHAAVFAAPAVYEPFGLTVLEAAAAGCALVLADIPTFRELWRGAALFVEPRDQSAFSTAINRLCREPRLRGWMQRAARRRALRYTLSAMADDYCKLYARMLAVEPELRAVPSKPAEARP
jgi:glycosyltransferase involved in cell wall biosynthesis